MRDRFVQLGALTGLIGSVAVAGSLLQPIIDKADDAKLRYTNVSVEGAPPIVALGTAIGALRGLIVDYLWIKVNMMKEKGLFYEVMSDADLITKLQPRFGQVWSFHGHNMAYNISVMTDTPEERWNWVNSGINLVRNSGLRHNPNDMTLHKELAFWFSHKVDGVSDDAHLHYKRELAKEWHLLLGAPPFEYEARKAWLKEIADAPDTLAELEAEDPRVTELVQELTDSLGGFEKANHFGINSNFLMNYGRWLASKSSMYALTLGMVERFQMYDPIYGTFDRIMGNVDNAEPIRKLVAFLRKRVLLDDFNMDPQFMYELTEETGPIDWRHPQAHALYWAARGREFAEDRSNNEDGIYSIINNDRIFIQAMQFLARSGMMSVDPFSNDNPGRLSDDRWIKVLDDYFMELYDKHYETRGAGSDTFTTFHENFMTWAVGMLYRSGEIQQAQDLLERLDALYGSGGVIPNLTYDRPLDLFVQESTYGNYLDRPWLAYGDVQAALRRGYREGILLNRPKLLENALTFAKDLTRYFKESEDHDYVNKFGEARMTDLVSNISKSVQDVFVSVLSDPTLSLVDRLTIFNRAPVEQRRLVYDIAKPILETEFTNSPLSETLEFPSIYPEPPGMEEFRVLQAERDLQLRKDREDRAEGERQ
ncbi:MAG: hypothetical protein MK082_00405 [Phycisphaerales bacterium]|nr:hypothetical protein [Phycisphaerales bacterium]